MFELTRDHVLSFLSPCEKGDWEPFGAALSPNVRWWIVDDEEDATTAAGVYNFITWTDKVRNPISARLDLSAPLNMKVDTLEIIGLKAIAECSGFAFQRNGRPYNNRFCWIFEFDPDSGIVLQIREYMNSALVREVMTAPDNL
ncbi:hypothetical protein T439DRAFT_329069 [Meredithblackwellia eburnea MCA 4105]